MRSDVLGIAAGGEEQCAAESPLRLDPFALPPDTDFRFMLLLAAVLGAALFAYRTLYYDYALFPAHLDALQALPLYPQPSFDTTSVGEGAVWNRIELGWVTYDRGVALWMIAGVALLLAVACCLMLAMPVLKRRCARLVPLPADDAPELVDKLSSLCREAGLSHPPSFVWNPLNPAVSGLAYGRLGRYEVALTGGLVAQFYTDPPAFRAVVLHELAHLRNGDVDRTYFSIALWWALVAVALVPLALRLPFLGDSGELWGVGWRALALGGVVYLTLSAVLRAREAYADVRAATWDGEMGALRRVLEAQARLPGGWLRASLRLHPDPEERLRTLDDPTRLFHLNTRDTLATGIVAACALPSFMDLLDSLHLPWVGGSGPLDPTSAAVQAGLLFAPLAGGVLALGVWRATLLRKRRDRGRVRTARPGLGLGLGLVIGQALSLGGYQQSRQVNYSGELDVYFGQRGSSIATFAKHVGIDLVWTALLIVSLVLVVRWLASAVAPWRHVAVAAPRRAYWATVAAACAVLGILLGLLVEVRDVAHQSASTPNAGIGSILRQELPWIWRDAVGPLTLIAVVCLWSFPLAPQFWQGRSAHLTSARRPSFGHMAAWPRLTPHMRHRRWQVGSAARLGLVSGLAFCALLLAAALGLRGALTGSLITGHLPPVATLLQVGVAATVIRRIRWLPAFTALCATSVSGAVMALGMIVFGPAVGTDASEAGVFLCQVVVLGGLLALLSAWSTAELLAPVGRLAVSSAARGHSPRAVFARRGLCGDALMVALALLIALAGSYLGDAVATLGAHVLAAKSWSVTFQDPMTSNAWGWPAGPGCSFDATGYHVTGSVCLAPTIQTAYAGVLAPDVTVTVQARPVLGGVGRFYGIVFGGVGPSYYVFGISSAHTWTVVKVDGDQATTYVPDTVNPSIRAGSDTVNTLGVRWTGQPAAMHLDYYVNGTRVGQMDDPAFPAGYCGLAAWPRSQVVYSSFTVAKLTYTLP